MRKRITYGFSIAVLLVLIALVVWQGSFTGPVAPSNPAQTFIFWALSTLIFILMVTLGFMLGRTGFKLYVERLSNHEGSRIKTKLVLGALALSFMPVIFMVLYSVDVLNRNLDKWFTRPIEAERGIFLDIGEALKREMREKVQTQAALLAQMPETRLQLAGAPESPSFLNRFCAEQGLWSAQILPLGSSQPIASCGSMPSSNSDQVAFGRYPVSFAGRDVGSVLLASRMPVDVASQQRQIEQYNRDYGALAQNRRYIRQINLMILCLIALFVLFVATWLALFFARQISVPIAALLQAAQQVSRGNLQYRVHVNAIDELAGLVRGFNQMTEKLEANSTELEARRRFTEAILESIPSGVVSVDANGSIQRVNRALQKIFPEEQVVRARRIEDLFSKEDAAEIRYLMKRARRTGLASQQFERKDRSRTQHFSVTLSALEDRLSSGFVIVIEDTSELLHAQKAAAWNEVARRIAHEIKNPLTPIALSAERIIRQIDRAGSPDVLPIIRECATTIVGEVHSVKSLVDEFSQFSRFPAAQPARCELNEVVESALAIFSGRLEGVEIQTDLAVGLAPISVDRDQFKRVVVNLIDNAAEAMQETPVKRLFISTQQGLPGCVELIVADTGCGITADQREKLFLPYFSTKNRGTGLGLAIVNHIIADHGAHIRVEDNLPAGARFTVEIPALSQIPELATA